VAGELADDDAVRVVVLQSANPEFFIAHFDVALIQRIPVDLPPQTELNAFHAMCEAFRTMPKATIAIISGEDDPHIMRDAFAQGARGYLTKGRDIDQFTEGLRKVLDYGFYFPPEVTTPAPTTPAAHLTDREEEVVRALALGKVNKQLADMLGVSESTFKTHLRAIYRKLGVRTRIQAAGRARELGLLAIRRRA